MLIAPLTAKTMSKMVQGNCDSLLIAAYLSAKCPVFFAPAMDLDMYKHQSTVDNINKLKSFNNIHIPASFGFLASGLEGEGRMCEPEEIIVFLNNYLSKKTIFKGKNILITSGPTREAIDKVRYISNNSSGKMGAALVKAAIDFGATVTLITGPTNQKIHHDRLTIVNVTSADEMLNSVKDNYLQNEIIIFAAAVSDFTPENVVNSKIKTKSINLDLKPTVDIAKYISEIKSDNQFLVGFALENDNELENAKNKLINKKLDLIVLNSLNDEGAGFDFDTNQVKIIDKKFNISKFKLKSKKDIAIDIFNKILELN
jgi:phosphopantothenoylcysteine decarboxylase/phosphopantothenate--cysteine ligase